MCSRIPTPLCILFIIIALAIGPSLCYPALAAQTDYNLTISVLTPSVNVTNNANVVVKVVGAAGNINNENVTLIVEYPDGKTWSETATTDANGDVSFTFTTSTRSGNHNITAISSTYGNTATTSIQVWPAYPSRLSLIADDGLLSTGNTYYLMANKTASTPVTAVLYDPYNNTVPGYSVSIDTSTDKHLISTTDSQGRTQAMLIGPYGSSFTESVSASCGSIRSNTCNFRFVRGILELTSSQKYATAGSDVTVTASFKDGSVPVACIPVDFDLDMNGELKSFTIVTDANGEAKADVRLSNVSGNNYVAAGISTLGRFNSTIIQGINDISANITGYTIPEGPIEADGTSIYYVVAIVTDVHGNPVCSIPVNFTVTDDMDTYQAITNEHGVAYAATNPSTYVGNISVMLSTLNNLSTNITLRYVAGPPEKILLKADPNVIASSDVDNTNEFDVHSASIRATVMDEWYHPLKDIPVNIYSQNVSAGNITGPESGLTDINGEFLTTFKLGESSNGTGTVKVRAVSGPLSATTDIIYTNRTFLSVSASINPRNVTVNDTVNITLTVRGIGWKNRITTVPVDVMLITDRSGSMDWYSTKIYPSNEPAHGTFDRSDREYVIDSFTAPDSNPIQVILSSPYTNYVNGSYYYGLKVVDSKGYTYTGSRAANENYLIISNPKAGRTYTIYGKAAYSQDGGKPEYSIMVLTKPKRLGSRYDTDSAAKVAAIQFINNMSAQDQVGLVSFSTSARVDSHLASLNSQNKAALTNAINALSAFGGTDIYTGIRSARNEFAANSINGHKKVAIILTDGYSQSPDQDILQAQAAARDGIVIYTIGMGMSDEETLSRIAEITGGKYYRVYTDLELSRTYNDIARDIKEKIAETSNVNILSERCMVNGTMINSTEYVPRSAMVTAVNGSVYQQEPVITSNPENYSISWDAGPICINDTWSVRYQMMVKKGGLVFPIGNGSSVTFMRPNLTGSESSGLAEEGIYVTDSIYSTVSGEEKILSISIASPKNNDEMVSDFTRITWFVNYTGNETYSQEVYYASEPTGPYTLIDNGPGLTGDKTCNGKAYNVTWDVTGIQSGTYVIKVYARDEDNIDAYSIVTVVRPDNRGRIWLK